MVTPSRGEAVSGGLVDKKGSVITVKLEETGTQ